MKKTKKLVCLMLALAFVVAIFTACNADAQNATSDSPENSAAANETSEGSAEMVASGKTDLATEKVNDYVPQKDEYHIYATYKLVHAWYDTIKVGADAAIAEYADKGIDITLDWEAPIEPSGEDQVQRIESAIAKQPDVIAVDLSNPELAVAPINEAVDAGIPVIVFASADLPESKRTAFVGNDQNVSDAIALTDALVEGMGGEGELAILSGTIGAANHEERNEGFAQALANYPDVEVVDNQRDEDFVEKATQITENFIQKYPNLKGILCNNMSNPVGAAIAVDDAGKSGDILIGAYDHDRRTLEYLKEGTIYCTVLQNCYDMGYWMVVEALQIADGLEPGDDTYPEVFNVGSTIIYQEDAQEYIDMLYGEEQ